VPDRTILSILFAALVAIVCMLFARTSSSAPFGYDEADYMSAGQQGLWANYSDRNSMPLTTIVREGVGLTRDGSQRRSLSQMVRASGDISFYRHYHGPIYAYWIGAWHALGVKEEATYRATGLLLHASLAICIFLLFPRVFPDLPPVAAFVAGSLFVLSRTALVTATTITPHLSFELFACLTLFAVAEFLRTRKVSYWYVAAALIAATVASVETAAVLVAAVILTVVSAEWRQGWKRVLVLLGKGGAVLIITLALIWPKGVFELNALKGYLFLAYMAMYPKAFSPIGPFDLWGFKVKAYPFELVPLGVAFVSALIWLAKSQHRRALSPFLVYAAMFLAVTMIITLPYTYYHSSLMASLAVVTGVVFGELWMRSAATIRVATLAVVIGSAVWVGAEYQRERIDDRSTRNLASELLSYLDSRPSFERVVLVPQVLIPMLHYYHPEIAAIGYDDDRQRTERLAKSSTGNPDVFCAESVCRQFAGLWTTGTPVRKDPVGRVPETGETFYAAILSDR